MKFLIILAFVAMGFFLSACAKHTDNSYYERANKASEKSLNSF